MAAEDILVKFFIILALLFFLPQVINRLTRMPNALTELMIGIVLGIVIPSYFFLDDMVTILSALGIIALFVFSGMEVDSNFIIRNKKFFVEHVVLHILIFIAVGYTIQLFLHLSFQIAFLISLALTTPSASFIFSFIKNVEKERKQWVESKAIAGEVTGLSLMVILLGLSDIRQLVLSIATLALLIILLPYVLKYLYKKIFSKLIGTEFSFIFVIATISAFITEFIGIHFLIGAFTAGLLAKRFITGVVKEESYDHFSERFSEQLVTGFGFFALIFAPFYFYSVGLSIKGSMFAVDTLLVAIMLSITIVFIRISIMSTHRVIRKKELFTTAVDINAMLVPTLVFTFVIAEILLKQFQINELVYSTLMLYGVFTAIIGTAFFLFSMRNKDIIGASRIPVAEIKLDDPEDTP